jgi:hypothetical protein
MTAIDLSVVTAGDTPDQGEANLRLTAASVWISHAVEGRCPHRLAIDAARQLLTAAERFLEEEK